MTTNEISTKIAKLSLNANLQPSPELQKQLDTVKHRAEYTQQLLKEYREDPDKFMESNDEKSIQALIKDIDEVLIIKKEVEDDQKELRKFLKNRTDEINSLIETTFSQNGFNELKQAKNDIQVIKNELQFRRKQKRWAEVEPVFQENINNYPNIAQYTPELLDFSKFKINNEKLISGAVKQSPAMSTVLKKVRALIADIDAGITLMIDNPWGLNPAKQIALLDEFKKEPTSACVVTNGPIYKQRQDEEEAQAILQKQLLEQQQEELRKAQEAEQERLRQMEEERRLAKIQQDALAQQALAEQMRQAQLAQEAAQKQAQLLQAQLEQFKQTVVPQTISAKYPQYIEDMFRRNTNTQLQNNDVAKANELYHLLHSVVHDQQSPAFVSTNGQPRAILELARFILDL